MLNLEKSPRRFYLLREEDISGVSGVGLIAFGICFFNGKCVISWLGEHSSLNEYDSLEDLEFIHSHNGSTKVVWIDEG